MRKEQYRDDIQGIRAIGAILILVYHIWVHKVSGGVDVFFVVSGYLMTNQLFKKVSRDGKIGPVSFLAGIAGRVSPSAYTVLISTLILAVFFLPPPYWRLALNDYLASALQVQNLQLIRVGADYLDRDSPLSPFQQFWALSIQVQFYLILPLVVFIAHRASSLTKSSLAWPAVFGAVWMASLSWSIYITNVQPERAYFDTAARFWEFLTGGIIAITALYIRPTNRLAVVLQATGLVLLFATGLFVPESLHFPGFVALVPVVSATLLIVGGFSEVGDNPVARMLSCRPLLAIGRSSFTIYLWHWPILVLAQHSLSTNHLDLLQGTLVILGSVVLAFLTTRFVEEPLRNVSKRDVTRAALLCGAFLIPAIGLGLVLRSYVVELDGQARQHTAMLIARGSGDQSISIQDDATILDYSYLISQYGDVAPIFKNGCDSGITSDEVIVCEYGDPSSSKIVVLVGGSHTAQLHTLFDTLGADYGFKLLTITKAACSFGYLDHLNDSCRQWNQKVLQTIKDLEPDYIITNSTRAERSPNSSELESVPVAYLETWQELQSTGAEIIGIRDNPWFFERAAVCLWNNPSSASKCGRSRREIFAPSNPADSISNTLATFTSVDFSDLYCSEDLCPVFRDGIIMYRDKHHFTASYLDYIESQVAKVLEREVPELFSRSKRAPEATSKHISNQHE